jgi:hypothetical protein
MKNYFFLFTLLISFSVLAQESTAVATFDNAKPNELKLNLALTIAGIPEISYERILSDETSAGISMRFSADDQINEKFSISPYFRFFFGKKQNASGFFLEGFGVFSSYKATELVYNQYPTNNINFPFSTSYTPVTEKYSNVGLGFSIGGKWVTKRGFIFEIFTGAARNLTNSSLNSFYGTQITGRGGITAGYRF